MNKYSRERIGTDIKYCRAKRLCSQNNSNIIATGVKVFIYRSDRVG